MREALDSLATDVEQSGSVDPVAVGRRYSTLLGEISRLYPLILERIANEVFDLEVDNFLAGATRDTIANWLGSPVDAEGNLVPEPGTPGVATEDMSLTEILLAASALVFLQGDSHLSRTRPLTSFVAEPDIGELASRRRGLYRHWQQSLSAIFGRQQFGAVASDLSGRIDAGEPVSVFRQGLGVVTGKVVDSMTGRLRADAELVRGNVVDYLMDEEFDGAIAGWILHSVFAPKTRPEHASRDGTTFMKDDSGDLPWSENFAFRPPYAPNCLCFQSFIEEGPNPDGSFGLGIPGAPDVSARSFGSWDTWFSAQSPGVQRQLIGDQRFFGANQFGGQLQWADVVDTSGRIMSARRLANESFAERAARRLSVRQALAVQNDRNRQAWATGKFRLTAGEESGYRKRLDSYLRRVL